MVKRSPINFLKVKSYRPQEEYIIEAHKLKNVDVFLDFAVLFDRRLYFNLHMDLRIN